MSAPTWSALTKSMEPTRSGAGRERRSRWLAAVLAAIPAACTGPSLSLAAAGPCYVDGHRQRPGTVPFRYYGTVIVDVLPPDADDGSSDWALQPSRSAVEVPAPVSPWLFPLDLPLELLDRLFAGRRDQAVTVQPAPTPEPVVAGFPPAGLERLRERALSARTAR